MIDPRETEITRAEVLHSLLAERERQDSLWGDQTKNSDVKWLNITSRIVHKMYDIVDDDDSQDILYSEVIQGASLLMAWAEYLRKRHSKKEQNG